MHGFLLIKHVTSQFLLNQQFRIYTFLQITSSSKLKEIVYYSKRPIAAYSFMLFHMKQWETLKILLVLPETALVGWPVSCPQQPKLLVLFPLSTTYSCCNDGNFEYLNI